MERKEFFKFMSVGGVCSCFAIPSFLSGEKKEVEKKATELDFNIQFMQAIMPKLIDILNNELGKDKTKNILSKLGKDCSNFYASLFSKYKNDLNGYLEMLKQVWGTNYKHDNNNKKIHLIGKKTEKCACPFVNKSKMSKDFCNCSLGWQKNTFAFIIGKPVKATITESVLRGGNRCSFKIDYS